MKIALDPYMFRRLPLTDVPGLVAWQRGRMIRLGLIGCGRIGRVHADSTDVHPRAPLVRVYAGY